MDPDAGSRDTSSDLVTVAPADARFSVRNNPLATGGRSVTKRGARATCALALQPACEPEGEAVGMELVWVNVGGSVGVAVVGDVEGNAVGSPAVGLAVGLMVGPGVVGEAVGGVVGSDVAGEVVGDAVGPEVIGEIDGDIVG